MSGKRMLWRPRLFAAAGAGFEDDATVQDGVHLRWALDPRLGLPRAPDQMPFVIAYSNTKEATIEKADLFSTSSGYPIHSNVVSLGSGEGSLERADGSIYFTRPLDASQWEASIRFLSRRPLIDVFAPPGPDGQRFLAYMDDVVKGLGPTPSGDQSREREDAVAVDLRFREPSSQPPSVIDEFDSLAPTVTLATVGAEGGPFRPPNLREDLGIFNPDVFDRFRPDVLDPGRFNPDVVDPDVFNRFRPRVYADVLAYDHCDRLVDRDWIGQYSTMRFRPPFVASGGGWKLTARLRAAGIRRVEVVRRPSRPALVEDEIRWVLCDEYAATERLWVPLRTAVLDPDPEVITPDHVRDVLYGPFRAAASGLDWDRLADLAREIIGNQEVQDMLQAPGTFEMFSHAVKLSDESVPAGTDDSAISLPLLAALHASAVDPVVANVLGMYLHENNPDLRQRDWRIVAWPPFVHEANLRLLDDQLRDLWDPGSNFFYQKGDSVQDTTLAGLVLNALVSPKPQPPTPTPIADVETHLLPSSQTTFNLFVRAAVDSGPPRVETRPWLINAAYELERALTGEPTKNVLDDGSADPVDEFGIVPDVVIPDYDPVTCMATTRVVDTFSRPAVVERRLAYLMRGYDVFGRPSDVGKSPPHDLVPPCLAPPPPTNVSSQIVAEGGDLFLHVVFSISIDTTTVQASREDLEILVHEVPIIDGVAPEETTWSGSRPARRLTLGFEPSTQALHVAPVVETCAALSWSASDLVRASAPESSCQVKFSTPAIVVLETFEALPTSTTGLHTYRATLRVGSVGQFSPGRHGWSARMRIRGSCTLDGSSRHSPEIVTRATRWFTTPPAAVIQPPTERIALSTYPDVHGSSFYSIDLRNFLSSADQAQRSLVKVLLGRLDRLTSTPETLVDGAQLIDPPGMIALAKATKLRFQLLTDPPRVFDPARPRYDVEVPGDLEQVYVVGVVGSNEYLEEGSWQAAAFTVFRTPPRRTQPVLEWIEARPVSDAGSVRGVLALSARLGGPLSDPGQPPKVQVLRRNVSQNGRDAVYVDTVIGTADPVEPDRFRFDLDDVAINDWQRYEYEAVLLEFSVERAQRVRALAPVVREIVAPWAGTRSAVGPADPMTVATNPAGGFVVSAECASGEFDVSLTKVTPDDRRPPIIARIERGRLVAGTNTSVTLTAGNRYVLRFDDPDPAPGTYTLRVRFGQRMVWSNKADTP